MNFTDIGADIVFAFGCTTWYWGYMGARRYGQGGTPSEVQGLRRDTTT